LELPGWNPTLRAMSFHVLMFCKHDIKKKKKETKSQQKKPKVNKKLKMIEQRQRSITKNGATIYLYITFIDTFISLTTPNK
jgi:hypothetical protein